ncbi:MAG: IS30 family transposase [Campylobacterota bacterium]|nr:IS30 family transposase [Campylobacterota bacterium]
MKYKHLTLEQRYHISALKKAGFIQKEIAIELEVSESTISRELKRNSSTQTKSYNGRNANKVSVARRRYASKKSNLKMDIKLKNIIKRYIIEDWSPEQISKRLKEVNIADISYVRIYQLIEQDKLQGGDLYTHLRFYHTGHRRAKYGSKSKGRIKDRTSISQRDKIVEDKSRIGDWEIDTIVGAGKKGAITTVVERVTSLVRISIPTTKKAIDIENETIRIMTPLKDKIYTITSDNGLEFTNHQNISNTLDYKHYFCHPYSSWERGLNEYTNGLIRQYIPKGTIFEDITPEYIKMIEDKLNNRPRKALNWKTPNEVFYGLKISA